MAQITINIPTERGEQLCKKHNYQEYVANPDFIEEEEVSETNQPVILNPQSKQDFVQFIAVELLKRECKSYMKSLYLQSIEEELNDIS
jgi:hypothetical protein